MRRVATLLALASCLFGCQLLTREPVALLTGVGPGFTFEEGGCYTNWVVGQLVVDPTYGTAIEVENGPANERNPPVPVMWRPGYTGRRAGSEVEVLDPTGKVVALTGRRYKIEGGSWYKLPYPFLACGFVMPA